MNQKTDFTMARHAPAAILSRPEAYGPPFQPVETIETHMAWVFLTGQFAYKLKKPVYYGYLDFRTVEARRRDCEAEVRLNRRLAPLAYLGVVPLTAEHGGDLSIDGSGETVDWLVKMRRLPRDRMLDRMISDQSVSEPQVRHITELMAKFYEQSRPIDLEPNEYCWRLAESVRATQRELMLTPATSSHEQVFQVADGLLDRLERDAHLFERRIREGRIVDAHGDLRPEHICFEEPRPTIIDCLEFNRDFRILDTASELAFLALECERMGAAWIGESIFHNYRAITRDELPEELKTFYRSFHAYTRAKIAIWHLRDFNVRTPNHWVEKANSYLQMAAQRQ